MIAAAWPTGVPEAARSSAPPLIPDGEEARRWAEQELADPVYRAAEPTAFDRFARAVGEFFADLFSGGLPAGAAPWLAVLVLLVIVGVVVGAVLVWGRPRRRVRSGSGPELFGDAETRSAAELRRDADRAVGDGQWDQAVILRVRAIARSLAERTLVDPVPGATVHGFAREASAVFPAEQAALERAADVFDDARYLHRPVTAEAHADVRALDDRLAAATPAALAPLGSGRP